MVLQTNMTAMETTEIEYVRRPIAEAMNYEILVNEQHRVWVFHDQPIPGRLAWIEYDTVAGMLEFIPHHMTEGILYAEIPSALRTRICAAGAAYLYLTVGDEVKAFQKVPIQIKKH